MQSRKYIHALLIGALLAACSAETPDEATQEKAEDTAVMAAEEEAEEEMVEYLFVQHADSVTLEDGLLTFEGIGDDVLYFSDRPHRIVGRVTIEEFIEAWDEGEDSFATTPPNAVLTVKKEGELVDLTAVLKHPVLTDRTLVYTVGVLDGPESGSGSLAALFIDAFVKQLRNRAGGALKRGISRGSGLRGRVRGGEPGRPGDFGSAKRGGEAGGRGGGREVHRRGSRQGAEIR